MTFREFLLELIIETYGADKEAVKEHGDTFFRIGPVVPQGFEDVMDQEITEVQADMIRKCVHSDPSAFRQWLLAGGLHACGAIRPD